MPKPKIILFIVLIILLTSCKKKIVEPNYPLTFRVNPSMKVNFDLELNNSIIKSGTLEDSWNDITVNNLLGNYKIYYWNENYYIDSTEIFYHSSTKQNFTITKELILKEENKKGNLAVSLSSELYSNQSGIINLNFKVNDTIKYMSYCLYRTIGIISAKPLKDVSVCYNYWTNTTSYGNLTDNQYYCNGLITKCKSVKSFECENEVMPSPRTIQADNCYFLGKTLRNEEFNIPIEIKTMYYFDEKDYLKVYIFDMDLSQRRILNQRVYSFDEDLGIEDKEFILK